MYNVILSLSLALCVAGCTAPSTDTGAPTSGAMNGDVTVCVHKYSSNRSFSFIESQKQRYKPRQFNNLKVWHITDVDGNRVSVNEYEIQNYNCTPAFKE